MQSEKNLVLRHTLRNGNRSGDPSKSPRCGAKTRSGTPCRAPAMKGLVLGQYTKCRMRGGASTGPRTPEGLERCRRANWKHGKYSAERKADHRKIREFCRLMAADTKLLKVLERATRRERKREAEYPVHVVPVAPGGESSEG